MVYLCRTIGTGSVILRVSFVYPSYILRVCTVFVSKLSRYSLGIFATVTRGRYERFVMINRF